MKILHLDFDDLESPLAGGQAVRTFEINRRLVQMGHQVTVITLNYPGAKPQIKSGIRYLRSGTKKSPLNFFSYFLTLPFLLRKNSFDLVVEDNIPPFTFGLSPLYTKKPVIAQIQSFGAKYASQKYKIPFHLAEKNNAKLYKNFIVLTNNMKEKIHALNSVAQIAVIPNGINSIQTIHPTEKNYLLFLGRISWFTKGLDYLLQTMAILQKKAPQRKLIIAGKGPDEKKLVHIIKKKHLTNTESIGFVKGKPKDQILSECLMLLQPSRHETFGLSILEAASFGKPSVCFDIENLKENMAKEIGVATPAFNIEKYAAAILELINDEKKRRHLGINAHEWSKNYLWDNIAKTQENFYRQAITQN